MRDLILVGLGTVHQRLLAHLPELTDVFRVSVVAPHGGGDAGALADWLAGEARADIRRTPAMQSATFVHGRAVGCHPLHQRLWLADGRVLGYHALSLNVGARRLPDWAARPATGEPHVWSGHSMHQMTAFKPVAVDEPAGPVVIVGGSRRALEIAGGLSLLGRADITLLWPAAAPSGMVRAACRRLAWRGVDVILGAQASALGPGSIRCTHGRRFAAAQVVWAGPATPGAFVHSTGLAAADAGLRVDRRLRSPRAPSIHAAGAAATIDGRAVLSGSDAERQACVIAANLKATTGGHALRRYRPSRRAPAIDLGGGERVSAQPLMRWLTGPWSRRHKS